jgi:hypothetical protein
VRRILPADSAEDPEDLPGISFHGRVRPARLCESDEEFKARVQQHPFLNYAASQWPSHYSLIDYGRGARDLLLTFLADEARVLGPKIQTPRLRLVPRDFTGVHILAFLGSTEPLLLLNSQLPSLTAQWRRNVA